MGSFNVIGTHRGTGNLLTVVALNGATLNVLCHESWLFPDGITDRVPVIVEIPGPRTILLEPCFELLT
jgi:hypothetical protein